ncbi:MAG: hypothetical protein KIS66_17020 [Fimbriimonadaceae bacterium]|nr:hypothetical protein [Fimbriimonadaceae bacterium]
MVFAAIFVLAGSALQYEVRSGEGLSLRVDGIPLVRGSGFQYYEPGWTKGYYSSTWGEQRVEDATNGKRLTFRSDDGRAHGTQTFVVLDDGLSVRSEFHWEGETPVNVELTGGLVWAPAVERGTLTIDGKSTRPLGATRYASTGMRAERHYGSGRDYTFDAPIGTLSARADVGEWLAFDGRGYDQDWAQGRALLWLGVSSLPVAKGSPVVTTIEWHWRPSRERAASETTILSRAQTMKEARRASEPLPILPKPKELVLSPQATLRLGRVVWPPVRGAKKGFDRVLSADFETLLAARWKADRGKRPVSVDARVTDMKLPAEGYSIEVTPQGVAVTGQDEAGLRHAARMLAKLVRPSKGTLVLPLGRVSDWPSLAWRGVHLFVGPQAFALHRRLFDRALGPLGFNKVVLQCERTDWKATPGIATSITMPRDQLAAEFAWLRDKGVDPIPLIQSFGHMEWLFANGKNRDIAFNPAVPYAVDVTLPRTRTVLEEVWSEAVSVLKPKTVHFGLDEVDMRGYPADPELVTTHWERHLPWLGSLAERLGVRPMLWGDKALAPGEAIDAALGDTREHAARRRAVISRDAVVSDWHYRADQDPEPFRKSLRLWSSIGRFPVASAWYRPENVRGLALAAKRERAGYLQTTWAGYESSEENVLREFRQFAVMVTAADYAWSGREERVEALPYDATTVLGKMLYGPEGVAASVPGTSLLAGRVMRFGEYAFTVGEPVRLVNRLTRDGAVRPAVATLNVPGTLQGSMIALLCRVETTLDDGEPMVKVEVVHGSGAPEITELRYGHHARSESDARGLIFGTRSAGESVVTLPLDPRRPIRSIRFVSAAPHVGFTVRGATVIGTSG